MQYISENPDLKGAIVKGIKDTCNKMLAPVPLIGVKAIRWVARSIPKWADKKGAKTTNHYLGQLIRMQTQNTDTVKYFFYNLIFLMFRFNKDNINFLINE
ncbi:DUF4872 domain-containing protein [Chryseobacterium sp. MFBS3-17]|uniref:DUF4872 domain-containing protein n=1 Tax=Chryseobacterium sp. MFBS3-17 TaxID=2886689 RepID=UPI00293F46DA|nr:DUF4872 domain-containing protein [Chryseobacterium sp. MFBS3-17]